MSTAVADAMRLEVGGIPIEIFERGKGKPLLFLHPGHPAGRLDPASRAMEALAEKMRVIAPTHPGFGTTPAPAQLTTVDDLAYLYLDLLEAMNLKDVVLAGASFGGWIAAEIAVKSTERVSHLILIDAVGIKAGDRETRDIPDIFALAPDEVTRLVYHDPQKAAVDYAAMSDEQLGIIDLNSAACKPARMVASTAEERFSVIGSDVVQCWPARRSDGFKEGAIKSCYSYLFRASTSFDRR